MNEKIILTPELELAIKRTVVTDLLLMIGHQIIDKYYDSNDLSVYNELMSMINEQANLLRNRYAEEKESKLK